MDLAENFLEEADKWAAELHTPTELSKGMTMTEIDEQQAHFFRQHEIELKEPKKGSDFIRLQNKAKKENADSFKYNDKRYIKKVTKTGLIYYKKSWWS